MILFFYTCTLETYTDKADNEKFKIFLKVARLSDKGLSEPIAIWI